MSLSLTERLSRSWTSIKFLAKIIIGTVIFSAAPKLTAPVEIDKTSLYFPTEQDYTKACIFFEAKGEGRKGMQAVAAVLNNRLKHKNFPATMQEVVTQHKQFSWVHLLSYDLQYKVITGDLRGFNKLEQESYKQAEIIAQMPQKQLLKIVPAGTLYFHADYVAPKWSKVKVKTTKIGRHIFYKEKSMQIETSKLTGKALDWAVAKCEGMSDDMLHDFDGGFWLYTLSRNYSEDWHISGPIIARERISVICAEGAYSSKGGYASFWIAESGNQCTQEVYGSQGDNYGTYYTIDEGCISGETPLIAAMRCYVWSKLGSMVEIPKEFLT